MDDSIASLEGLIEERARATSPAQMLAWATSGVASAFRLRLGEAREQIRAYERDHRSTDDSAAVKEAGDLLGRQARLRLRDAADRYWAALTETGEATSEKWSGLPDAESVPSIPPEQRLIVGRLVLGEERLSEVAAILSDAVEGPDQMRFVSALLGDRMTRQGSPLVLDSILVLVYSAIDDLLHSLVRLHASTEVDETIDETPAAFIQHLDATADRALRGGPDSWRTHIQTATEFDLSRLVSDWDALVELHLRRNRIVHSGGRADARYLDPLPDSIPGPSPGDLLVTSPQYLRGAVNMLLGVGEGLALLWPTLLVPDEIHMLDRPVERVVDLLHEEAWGAAESMASVLKDFTSVDRDRAMLEINEFMARREQAGSIEPIEAAVREWRPPNDEPIWGLAVAALLDDRSRVREILVAERDGGDDLAQYRNWPLMKPIIRSEPAIEYLFSDREPRPRRRRRRR